MEEQILESRNSTPLLNDNIIKLERCCQIISKDKDFARKYRYILNSNINFKPYRAELKKLYDLYYHENNMQKAMDIMTSMNLSVDYLEEYVNFFENIHLAMNSKKVIEFLINLPDLLFILTLDFLKFGKISHFNNKKEEFARENIPIIRLMDECLKNHLFEKYCYCARKLEDFSIEAYWAVSEEAILENIQYAKKIKKDFFAIFCNTKKDIIRKYVQPSDLIYMSEKSCSLLLEEENFLPEWITSLYFIQKFQQFSLRTQIYIIEKLEKQDYSDKNIQILHKLLNKSVNIESNQYLDKNFLPMQLLEISYDKLIKLYEEIKLSTYFKKNLIKNSYLWTILTNIIEQKNISIDIQKNYYEELKKLYELCRDYATNSIVSSLYPLNLLSKPITYMESKNYNILVRVKTIYDHQNLDTSFQLRTFAGFSILTQDNFSHYGNSLVYGYYSKISPDMIAHIYPQDSLSESYAKYSSQLTDCYNMFYNIDDLNAATYKRKTYNQLCIRTKTKDGEIIKPDCIIDFDEPKNASIEEAKVRNIKLLVLKRNENTIEYNDDIYQNLK